MEDDEPGRSGKWIRVALTGVKNLKLGYDAEVEIKAGASYQKKMYRGVPLAFDLGGRLAADTVRITWPNGLIQNETKQLANHSYIVQGAAKTFGVMSDDLDFGWEAIPIYQRRAGGGAVWGQCQAMASTFPVDHDEYVQIPGDALRAVNGKYEVRVSEELSEVSYLDQLELLAVDHPAGTEIFTNEKWKGPPYPEFRLFGVSQRIYPKRARDGEGPGCAGGDGSTRSEVCGCVPARAKR